MPEITVKLAGRKLFDWEGDARAIENTIRAVEDASAQLGFSPDVLAGNVVRHLPTLTIQKTNKTDPAGAHFQMMAIIYYLLSQDTHHPDHPGKYRDYAAAWDFTFDICPRPDGSGGVVNVDGAWMPGTGTA
jgi:hypothetical protein